MNNKYENNKINKKLKKYPKLSNWAVKPEPTAVSRFSGVFPMP